MNGTAQVTWRECTVHAAILVVVLVVLFPATFLHGEVLLPGGLLFDHPPWSAYDADEVRPARNEVTLEAFLLFHTYYAVTARAIDEGDWPLWNPLEFGGIPLLAGYQAAVFYPPRILHAFLDLCEATTLFVLLKIWLCGMTAYLCARYFRLGVAASRFASLGWMLSGYTLVWAYWADPDVGAWLPVMLMAAEMLIDGRYRRGFFAMAFAAVMALLAGHPESAFTMSLGVGAYLFLRLVLDRAWGRRLLAPMGIAGAAWVLALLVCAVQLLPFVEYLPLSQAMVERPAGNAVEQAIWGPGAVAFWVPRFFGANPDGTLWVNEIENFNFVGMIYPGIAVMLALPLVFVRGRRNSLHRRRLLALGLPCILSLLLAFDAPGIRVLHTLPVFSATWGCWYMTFPMFCLVLIAAMGIQQWFSQRRRFREGVVVLPGVLLGCGVVGFFFWLNKGLIDAHGVGVYVQRQLALATLFALACLACLVGQFGSRRLPVLAHLLGVVLAFDLIVAADGLHDSAAKDHVLFETDLTRCLQEATPQPRINATSARIPTGLLQAYGIEQQMGYDGILPERMFTFFGRMSGDTWNPAEPVCATDIYLHDPDEEPTFPIDDARFVPVGSEDGIDIYRNDAALPRAFLVGRIETVPNEDALFDFMRHPEFDPSRMVVTDRPPSGPIPHSLAAQLGNARVLRRSATRVILDVDSAEDAALVLSDAFYPGWRAWVGTDEVNIWPAYHAFRGILVPAGHHRVEFRYDPLSFRIGLWTSTAALCLSAAFALLLLMKAGRRRDAD
ncbi:MAG: hypothetical protein GY851_33550 [bacterium]|nr:hypothetical protein [bacterium]